MRSPPFEPSARNKDGKVKPDEANGSSSSSTVGGQKILHDVVEDWGDEVWMSADQRAREAEMQWRMVGRSESDADAIRAFQRATEAYRVMSDLRKKRIYEVSGSVGLENRMKGPRFQDPQRCRLPHPTPHTPHPTPHTPHPTPHTPHPTPHTPHPTPQRNPSSNTATS